MTIPGNSKNALTVTTALTLPATALDSAEKYAKSGGAGWFGDLLKHNGKDGSYSAGAQGLEVPEGTRLVAIVPGTMCGHTKWVGGGIVDQSLVPLAGFDLRAHRATLDQTDRAEWSCDERGKPQDAWSETAMVPMVTDPRQQSGAEDRPRREYTFSTFSIGGLGAVKGLIKAYVDRMRSAPESSGWLPVIELHDDSYQHRDKQKGRIHFPVFDIIGWVRPDEVFEAKEPELGLAANGDEAGREAYLADAPPSEHEPDAPQFADYRSKGTKASRRARARI